MFGSGETFFKVPADWYLGNLHKFLLLHFQDIKKKLFQISEHIFQKNLLLYFFFFLRPFAYYYY
jgi:hypothetical protein